MNKKKRFFIAAISLLAVALVVAIFALKDEDPQQKEHRDEAVIIAESQWAPSPSFAAIADVQSAKWYPGLSYCVPGNDESGRVQMSLAIDVVGNDLKDARKYFDFCVDLKSKTLIPLSEASKVISEISSSSPEQSGGETTVKGNNTDEQPSQDPSPAPNNYSEGTGGRTLDDQEAEVPIKLVKQNWCAKPSHDQSSGMWWVVQLSSNDSSWDYVQVRYRDSMADPICEWTVGTRKEQGRSLYSFAQVNVAARAEFQPVPAERTPLPSAQ